MGRGYSGQPDAPDLPDALPGRNDIGTDWEENACGQKHSKQKN